MNEHGFLSGITLYGAIGAVAVIGALGVGLKIQSLRLERCQADYAAFKLETKRIGEAKEKEAKEKEARDLKLKERADADHKRAVARLNRDIQRLRDDRARSSIVPPAPSGSASPQRACFDRPELDRAVSGFVAGIEELIAEGAGAVAALDAAKAWAQNQ